jgi:DNA-binding FrmR family transcriptional regulator
VEGKQKSFYLLRLERVKGQIWALAEKVAEKCHSNVTPAKAGVQKAFKRLDSCFRRNGILWPKWSFSETLGSFQ